MLIKAFDLGKRGEELENLLSDPSQWNFGDEAQTPKKRNRRRRRKKSNSQASIRTDNLGTENHVGHSDQSIGKVLPPETDSKVSQIGNGSSLKQKEDSIVGQNNASEFDQNSNGHKLAQNGHSERKEDRQVELTR